MYLTNLANYKMNAKMEKDFWENKWIEKQTGWDVGYASPAIKFQFQTTSNRAVKILIPGCGNAYEAEEIFALGFENLFVIDISPSAIDSFKKRCPDFPESQIICSDFFTSKELEDLGPFDFVIEQTFFCAINPEMREDYCKRMNELLSETGSIVGLMFNFPLVDGPPYGGSKEEYIERFNRFFESVEITDCKTSIPPREGREYLVKISNPKK
jgi:SAM-dependent methyltransferase